MKKSFISKALALVTIPCMLVGCSSSISVATATPSDTVSPVETSDTAPVEVDALAFAEGTVLRMATGYNSTKTGLFFDADTAGSGITLADGNTYNTGDLKPTWVEVQNRLGMVFEDKYQGNSASAEFEYWKERLSEVDMVSGTASTLTEYGEAGYLVNIAEYLDLMPNFSAYLEKNPIVRLSITGNTSTGAIYFSPYFDGVDDIERMPLMRVDWVIKLLDGDGDFAANETKNLKSAVYEPYMPTSGSVTVDVVNAEGTAVEQVTKNYDAAGNIVQVMNDAMAENGGTIDGVTAVNLLRKYIDEAYDGYYGENRSDLFIGQNAAWDADELVALLRCVVANPQTLNGTDSVQGLFSREDSNNQRRVDIFRFAGVLFGVRGLESRQDYLYVAEDGTLKDARQEEATYEALDRMNAIAAEGLISEAYLNASDETSSTYLENDLGFMSYDYNQTQTILNDTYLDVAAGEKYMAVMVPVARWYDGTTADGIYMRFTESWRSVKTDGWAISLAGVGNDQDKLYAALKLIDYAYSEEGTILMSYGPDAFIKTNSDGSYVTFSFNGEEWPEIADATYEELWDKAGGNYTNYARYYLGSTLSFMKSQAFEYQCTSEVGKEGAGYISTAIALGTIKHVELAITDNGWYTSVPTVLPFTTVENEKIGSYTDLTNKFSSSKGGENLLVNIIIDGYTETGVTDGASQAAAISSDMGGTVYLSLVNDAWQRDVVYYDSQN